MSLIGHKIVYLSFRFQCQSFRVSELKLWMKMEISVSGVAGWQHLVDKGMGVDSIMGIGAHEIHPSLLQHIVGASLGFFAVESS